MTSIKRPSPFLRFALLFVIPLLFCFLSSTTAPGQPDTSVYLRHGWAIHSACTITASGAELSSLQYHPYGWIPATVPTTVLAAQVAAGVYKDPYVGMNLRRIPGTSYPVGTRFSNLPMEKDSPYRCGWWYRKQLAIPSRATGKVVWLHFGGINNRANLWVNGHLVANSDDIAGAYRIYDFDITHFVIPGKSAVVAVEVFAPKPTDLGINWVDWNPAPPDKDMGLWGPVSLVLTGPVAVRSPSITTHFNDPSLSVADITITVELQNALDHATDGIVSGTLAGVDFEKRVHLAADESKSVSLSPQQFPQLRRHNPPLWWPLGMGEHPLETLTVRFILNRRTSDIVSTKVGIRDVTSKLTAKGARLFLINGKPILIRGGGWAQDMMLRAGREHIAEQIQMVRDMHLNTIRQEGKLEVDEFYRLTDKYGILVMPGWCCCDEWEHSVSWKPGISEYHEPDSGYLRPWTAGTLEVATASLRDQLMRLRSHPSVFVWLNGSDYPPTPVVERAYLDVEKEVAWPNPVVSSAGENESSITGLSGIKMTGPYDYVPPSYWETDKEAGGAFGFIAETSPGAAIPLPESLGRFLPAKDLWPINDVWNYHAGGGDPGGGTGYSSLDTFDGAMKETYGWPDNLIRYSRVAQTMAYDDERAMFEAYDRNKYISTGVIQWMLNNAWPSVIWHLYDYYLVPGGGYYGAKKACEPLHIQYSYDDHTVYVVNSTETGQPDLEAKADAYDLKLHPLFHKQVLINLQPDESQFVLAIPTDVLLPGESVYFVRLRLYDKQGRILSRNFYWMSSKPTFQPFATKLSDVQTRTERYPNMQALNRLLKAEVRVKASWVDHVIKVSMTNVSQSLAFQIQIEATRADGKAIPALSWSDNYIELLPGESRQLSAALKDADYQQGLKVSISGWNIDPVLLQIPVTTTVGRR